MTRQQYINGLRFDLDYLNGELDRTKEFFIWHLGDRLSRFQVKQEIQELSEELTKVCDKKNKDYKPWKDLD